MSRVTNRVLDHTELPGVVRSELLDLMLSEKVGGGAYRQVYATPLLPGKVVKVEPGDRQVFQNVAEWHAWTAAAESKWAEWLAPCRHVSHSGGILVMDRTTPLTDAQWDALCAGLMPSFLSDVKRSNMGWLDGRPVCHDYGYHGLLQGGLHRARMKRARDVMHWSQHYGL